MIETCQCEANEDLETLTISITTNPDSSLDLKVKHAHFTEGETVLPRATNSKVFGRSYDELVKLGDGDHVVCRCRRVGPPNAIFRPSSP
jgi:hypothetical protein